MSTERVSPKPRLLQAPNLWKATLGRLKVSIDGDKFANYFTSTEGLAIKGGVLSVLVGSIFAREALETRFKPEIQAALTRVAGRELGVRFVGTRPPTTSRRLKNDYISSKLTFESYAFYSESIKAREVAGDMLGSEGASGMLYVHAPVGMGSTHFLHALGNQAKQQKLTALYTSTERFASEFMQAIRTRTVPQLRESYASANLLLFDEAQQLVNKHKTQEFLCHILTDYELYGGAMVVVSEIPVSELQVSEKLRTRMAFGAQVSLALLDYDARCELIHGLAPTLGLNFNPQAVHTFALNPKFKTVRDVLGALKRLRLRTKELGGGIDANHIQALCHQKQVTVADIENKPERIVKIVCDSLKTTPQAIRSGRRDQHTSHARAMVAYFLREHTDLSAAQTAKLISKSHQSVLVGVKKIATSAETNLQVINQVADLNRKLNL